MLVVVNGTSSKESTSSSNDRDIRRTPNVARSAIHDAEGNGMAVGFRWPSGFRNADESTTWGFHAFEYLHVRVRVVEPSEFWVVVPRSSVSSHWYISTRRRSRSAVSATPSSASLNVSVVVARPVTCTSRPSCVASMRSADATTTTRSPSSKARPRPAPRRSFHARRNTAPTSTNTPKTAPAHDPLARPPNVSRVDSTCVSDIGSLRGWAPATPVS